MNDSSAELEVVPLVERNVVVSQPRLRGSALAHALALLAGKPARFRRRRAQRGEGDEALRQAENMSRRLDLDAEFDVTPEP